MPIAMEGIVATFGFSIYGRKSETCAELLKHINRYHEKRAKNNIAVKKFRKDKSVKDSTKITQLELVRKFDFHQ